MSCPPLHRGPRDRNQAILPHGPDDEGHHCAIASPGRANASVVCLYLYPLCLHLLEYDKAELDIVSGMMPQYSIATATMSANSAVFASAVTFISTAVEVFQAQT